MRGGASDEETGLAGDVHRLAGYGGSLSGDVDRLEDLLDDPGAGRPSGPSIGRHRRGGGVVPVLSVPESLRSVDLSVGRGAVRGMLLVAAVVIVVLGGRWVWTTTMAAPGEPVHLAAVDEASSQQEGGASQSSAPPDASPSQSPGQPEDGSPTGQPAGPPLLVHVTGQVERPGVVEVPAGARVLDAVQQAGGFTDEADQAVLNLARPVSDGEQIWVGRPGEEPPDSVGPPPQTAGGGGAGGGPGGGDGGGAGGGGGGGPGRGPLDLNTATQADLEGLSGVGPVTAQAILAWREEHGRFTSVDELLEVSGIGEKTLERLAPDVTVGP